MSPYCLSPCGLEEGLNDNLECAVFKGSSLNRRTFIKQGGLASTALLSRAFRVGRASIEGQADPVARFIETPVLNIGYEENGDRAGFPIVLLHGFPDDVRAWDEILPSLVKARYRILVPYLRGYGPTRFRDPAVPRTAEQAAIAQDLIDFVDALNIERFAVAGYDWGGRAACIAAVLNPDRIRGAVIIGGYTIQNTIAPSAPADPETERTLWYQWYFNTERGRAGLTKNRRPICRLLWETWSPNWHFSNEAFNRTATSFDNPDFVDVVIHSYRHRHGNAPGEKRFLAVEQQLAKHPKIRVPTIAMYGANDSVGRRPADLVADLGSFTSLLAQEVVAGVGHFLPREKPSVVSSSVLKLLENVR
jgi:pimeloyl-ACP methyl ester carboxylesterase